MSGSFPFTFLAPTTTCGPTRPGSSLIWMWTPTAKKRWGKVLMPPTRKVPSGFSKVASLTDTETESHLEFFIVMTIFCDLISLLSFGGGSCTIPRAAGREGASAASRGQEERQETSSIQTHKGQGEDLWSLFNPKCFILLFKFRRVYYRMHSFATKQCLPKTFL